MSDTITITGNIATEPELKRTPAGVSIATFRVASSQRRFDRATSMWVESSTNWYTVSAFRSLADHAYESLKKGHRVVVTGRLRLREWDTGAKKGTTAEIEVDAIGHDLLWGTTEFRKDGRGRLDGAPAPDGTDVSAQGAGWSTDAAAEPVSSADGGWSVPFESDVTDEHAAAAVGAGTPF